MESKLSPHVHNRLGLHYFPDTLHYRMQDIDIWLPEFEKMGIGWLTLIAPMERAIPEYFLLSLIEAGIQPILHFHLPTHNTQPIEMSPILLRSYVRWGVKYAAFYDQPNSRLSWSASDWAQQDLVERFMDLFIPNAKKALDEGLVPIFPPLKPGGDYWDLSFLKSSFLILQRRGNARLLDSIAMGAYAWINRRNINWGIGGPEKWPEARPYFTPSDSQDHLGFRIFDWYESIAIKQLGHALPIFLLRAGSIPSEYPSSKTGQPDLIAHADSILSAINLLDGKDSESVNQPYSLDNVVACNFWLLSADGESEFTNQAWFQTSGRLPIVNGLYRHSAQKLLLETDQNFLHSLKRNGEDLSNSPIQSKNGLTNDLNDNLGIAEEKTLEEIDPQSDLIHVQNSDEAGIEVQAEYEVDLDAALPPNPEGTNIAEETVLNEDSAASTGPLLGLVEEAERPISHYVLLPLYAWGASDWDMSIIQPLLIDSHPTVGFSLAEARLAERVTVVGGEGAISREALEMLRSAGCAVERVSDDGILIAPE